jgi:hypothetical protein
MLGVRSRDVDDDVDMSRPRGGCTSARPAVPASTSSMLIFDVVRLWVRWFCSGAVCGGASTSTPASLKVGWENGDTAGVSENLDDVLLDHVLKCAGGGREPTGLVGRFDRRSWRKFAVTGMLAVRSGTL